MPGNKDNQEPTFNILPHPAKTNDPADLQRSSGMGGGLQNDGLMAPFKAKGPYIMSKEIEQGLPPIATKEELHARQMDLNKK